MKNKYSKIGVGGIVNEGVFNRLPELQPAIGENINKNHKKLLLVGESNYFPDELSSICVFRNAEKWYCGSDVTLIPENMRKEVSNWVGGYKTFDRIFASMKNVLESVNQLYDTYLLQEAGYYNYFLRPASKRGKNLSFKKDCLQIDRDVAGEALCGVISIDNLDMIIFVSKYAHDEFKKYLERENINMGNTEMFYVYHPCSIWWYKHGGVGGKMKFETLLREKWL